MSRLVAMPMASPGGQAAGPEKAENQERARTLENLVRILAGYGKLRFVPFYVLKKHGETEENTPRRWRTVLGLEEIQYLPEDVDHPDENVALGRASHEVWHLLYSRPELIFDEPELSKSLAFQALWWAVEDPRVNRLGLKRHPGTRKWLDSAYELDYAVRDLSAERAQWAKELPLHIQFNYALIYEWWSGRPEPRVTDAKVLDALARARPAILRAIAERDAKRSFEIVRDEIWPIYKELVDEAYEREKQNQQQAEQGQDGDDPQDSDDDSDSDSQSSSSSSSGKQGKRSKKQQQKQKDAEKAAKEKLEKAEKEFRDKHASKVVDSPEKMSQAEKEKMKKELEKLRRKMGQKQDGADAKPEQQGQQAQGDPQAGDADGEGEESSKSADEQMKQRERLNRAEREKISDESDEDWETKHGSYSDYLARVQKYVPVMRAQFMQVLKRKIRRRVIRNRDSGGLDTDKLSRIPAGDAKDIFKESMVANKTLYRVSLLIDISGSMSGEKKERSIEGAVMLMESLDKVPGVVYEIVAFDDKPYVVKAYGERATQKVKEGVVKALLKNGGSTQSGKAVKEALERIRMGRGDKLMIMVNDGDPDNNFDREHYRAMVEAARDVDIHGVGLGPDAQLVLDLFPPGKGWWLKDAGDFAKRLREILQKKMLGAK